MLKRIITILFILGFLLSWHSVSQGAEVLESLGDFLHLDEKDFEGVILGVGGMYSTSPYVDGDEDLYVVPVIIGKYKKFYADGSRFGYILTGDDMLEVSMILDPRFMGYDSDDSTALDGMDDREWSLDGGLRLKWDLDYFVMDISGVADLMNRHQGQEARAVFSREFYDGFLTPRVGVKWQAQDLVDYYYGVLGDEATASRPEYEPKSSLNYIAGMRVGIPIGDHWALFGDVEYEGLGSEIKDSPIVDVSSIMTYKGGIVYRF